MMALFREWFESRATPLFESEPDGHAGWHVVESHLAPVVAEFYQAGSRPGWLPLNSTKQESEAAYALQIKVILLLSESYVGELELLS